MLYGICIIVIVLLLYCNVWSQCGWSRGQHDSVAGLEISALFNVFHNLYCIQYCVCIVLYCIVCIIVCYCIVYCIFIVFYYSIILLFFYLFILLYLFILYVYCTKMFNIFLLLLLRGKILVCF
jgi:hypothetical protein